MRKPISIFLALLVAAIVVAGCGSSSSDSGSSISKEEFIKKGDVICSKTDDTEYKGSIAYAQKHKKEFAKLGFDAGAEELTTAIILPQISKEANDLKALGIPDGDEDEVEAIFSEIEDAIVRVEKEPALIEADGNNEPFSAADKLAEEYGFKECSEIT